MFPGARFGRTGEGVSVVPRCRRAVRPLSEPSPLLATLATIPTLVAAAEDPWWIIGSAAVALHGVDPGGIADVDLLTSSHDAHAMLAAAGSAPDVRDRSAFRSVYGRLPSPALPVEVMGGLEVYAAGRWVPVLPQTRSSIRVGGVTVHVPDRAELIAILRLFGRPKDLARAYLLC